MNERLQITALCKCVVRSWFMRFSMVCFYMLKLMTLFGFPWTHLKVTSWWKTDMKPFSLWHTAGPQWVGVLLLMLLFSNQHCSLWEQ